MLFAGRDTEKVTALMEKAERYLAKGKLINALAVYDEISSFGDRDPRIYVRLGDIARRLDDSECAALHYTSAADCFVRQGFLIRAIAVCKVITHLDPSKEGVHGRLAELCVEHGVVKGERATAAGAETVVRRTPFFSDLTGEEFLEVVKKVGCHNVRRSASIFREGDDGDSIYIVASGRMEAVCRTGDGKAVRVATFGEGEFFGEFGFFSEEKRAATVKAVEPTALLEMKRADMLAIASNHPGLSKVLFDFYKERVVERFMAYSRVFRPMKREDRRAVLKRLVLERFDKGAEVMKKGEKGNTMYLIKAGRVEVWVPDEDGGGKRVIAELKEGDFFGEVALATSRPRTANVTAVTEIEAVLFSRTVMKEIIAGHPRVKEILKGIIKERTAGAVRCGEHASAAPML
ncbi:MAG: cyclic nucleotide-binding domain-containing protein [Thermodesulfobacteriota bacterium]